MPRELQPDSPQAGASARHPRADGEDLVLTALHHLRGSLSADGKTPGSASFARQEKDLREWADRLGLLLSASDLPAKALRGGQEHDLFHHEASDRYFKITRHGIFGLIPGVDLVLVSSGQDGRRFHLWEATPLEYLERLHLQNLLVPGLNHLEGVISQPNGDLSIVTSQPRFELVPVTTAEIDAWFATQGFAKIAPAAYYRAEDNLGVFDAHDKNLVRAGDTLVPFDVIPCHPAGGFLQFISETLAAGHHLSAVRTATTRDALPT